MLLINSLTNGVCIGFREWQRCDAFVGVVTNKPANSVKCHKQHGGFIGPNIQKGGKSSCIKQTVN